ncbi:Acyl-CoA hydrolase [Desulfocicer vacuolatum DSM 3385]|uniref:Acyl-CoA hydrolase n=2 Tax=Desulfocicer vacuolatum TaxID=2298 RepID=A0A1W2CCI9_9BACT|nr:bifunctional acetyl-CoA hydrolase/transferase family protein/GNAT family N-acetyltransferase [Desulfocicer vacuolatum]SMC82714.1 Acyl-CoA hydrolase [Desulfocicer vacuolatum DSM 3385]
MPAINRTNWESHLVSPETVFSKIKPGMSIFIGTGPAAPRTLMKMLLDADENNIRDIELIQLTVQGDVILSIDKINAQNYRLKSFFSGFVSSDTIASGQVDLISAYASQIPKILKSGKIPIDAAFIQITPPNEAGYCSLGPAVDVAREVMEQAKIVVGEINEEVPFTFGDTFVPIKDFDFLVRSTRAPVLYERFKITEEMDRVAANVASIIRDGDCLSFSHSPLFEALVPHLTERKDLGIHSLYFTDAMADLVKSGAVTNYCKSPFRGKSLTSYALGSQKLLKWLDRNPLVDFQGTDYVCNPRLIAENPQFTAMYEASKVDLLGGVSFPSKGAVITGPGEVVDFLTGADASKNGCTIIGLPSRNSKGEANVMVSLMDYPNQLRLRESVHMIVTEYGVANLKWRTIREKAQAMIEIAHPDDREHLVEQAKKKKIIYPNQIFIRESAHLYPSHISTTAEFKGGVNVKFRAIKPSDEEGMRKLFYRFSDQMIFYRFFYLVQTMNHDKMQEYVNVDYSKEMSIVGLVGKSDSEKIIAEARFVKDEESNYGEVAFLIDEAYQGIGLGTYLLRLLVKLARNLNLEGLTAEVLPENQSMIKLFQKTEHPLENNIVNGTCYMKMHFN